MTGTLIRELRLIWFFFMCNCTCIVHMYVQNRYGQVLSETVDYDDYANYINYGTTINCLWSLWAYWAFTPMSPKEISIANV